MSLQNTVDQTSKWFTDAMKWYHNDTTLASVQLAALDHNAPKEKTTTIKVYNGTSIADKQVKILNGNTFQIDDQTYQLAFTHAPSVSHTENDKKIAGEPFGEASAAGLYNLLRKTYESGSNISIGVVGLLGDKKAVQAVVRSPDKINNTGSINEMQTRAGNTYFSDARPTIGTAGIADSPTRSEVERSARDAQQNSRGIWAENVIDAKAYEILKAGKRKKVDPKELAVGNGFNSLYGQMDKVNQSNTDIFKIGDVILKVPPTHLTLTQLRTSYALNVIGAEARTISSYVARVTGKVNLVFTGPEIDGALKRILTQFRYCPINIIRSKDLFSRVASEHTWLYNAHYMNEAIPAVPITMDAITLYTIEGHPDSIGCALQFSLFNHIPYYDGEGKSRMEYFKMNFEAKGAKENNYQLKMTYDLEDAVHPYNLDIQNILEKKHAQYAARDRDSSVVITKITAFENMSQVAATDDIEKAVEALGKSIIDHHAHSISVHMENNFAWQPVIGFSQPTAQFLGPGATHVNVHLMTRDNDLIAKLLRTYNEMKEWSAFSYYDDRYMVASSLTRFAEAGICSMREVSTSSVDGHPGTTEINITFTKTAYSTDPNDRNNIAAYDEYWGLQRLIKAAKNDEVLEAIKSTFRMSQVAVLQGSLLERIRDNSPSRIDITSLGEYTLASIETVLKHLHGWKFNFSKGSSKYNFDLEDMINKKLISIESTSRRLNSYELGVAKIMEGVISKKGRFVALEDIISDEYASDSVVPQLLEIAKGVAANDPRPNYGKELESKISQLIVDRQAYIREFVNPMHSEIGISSTTAWHEHKVSSVFQDTGIYKMWTQGNLQHAKGRMIRFRFDATLVTKENIDLFASAFEAASEANSKPLSAKDLNINLADNTWPLFGCNIVKNFVDVSSEESFSRDIINYSNQARVVASMAREVADNKAKDLDTKGESLFSVPYAAHRYYPNIDEFVKVSPIMSGTVGRWFAGDSLESLRRKLSKMNSFAKDSISPLADTAAWKSVYGQSEFKGLHDLMGEDPNNPLNALASIVAPVSKRNIQQLTETGSTRDNYTEINPLAPSMLGQKWDKNNKPFSGLSDLTLARGMFAESKDLADDLNKFTTAVAEVKEDNVLNRANSADMNAKSEVKIPSNSSSHPANMMDYNMIGQGKIIGGSLQKTSAVTVHMLSYGLIPDSTGITKSVDRAVRNEVVIPAQMSIMAAEKRFDILSRIVGTTGFVPLVKSARPENESTAAVDNDALLTESEKDKLIIECFLSVDKYSKDKNLLGSDVLLGQPTDLMINAVKDVAPLRWTAAGRGPTTTYLINRLSRAKSIIAVYAGLGRDKQGTSAIQERYTKIEAKASAIARQPNAVNVLISEIKNKSNAFEIEDVVALIELTRRLSGSIRLHNDSVAAQKKEAIVAKETKLASKAQQFAKESGQDHSYFMTQRFLRSLLPTTGLENAFPTYKLYVIQSDTSDYKYYSLDDYYDFRQVQDLMVVRGKDDPVHLLRCRVVIDPRYITTDATIQQKTTDRFVPEEHQIEHPSESIIDTIGENSFLMGKMPLRIGMRICLKLGYHTDPRALDTVFIGTIVNLNGSMENTIYEIEAQGDGRELTVQPTVQQQSVKGENFSEIITQIMRMNPNVVHFGKTYGTWIERFSRKHHVLMGLAKAGYKSAGMAFGGGIGASAAVMFGMPVLAGSVLLASTVGVKTFMPYAEIGHATDAAVRDVSHAIAGSADEKIKSVAGWFQGAVFDTNKASRQVLKHIYETFELGNDPVDDNIFAVNYWNRLLDTDFSITINNRTRIWDVLQNIKRLYPNYAVDVRPYGSRSTLYFGPVSFNYWRTDDPVQAMAPQLGDSSNKSGLETSSMKRAMESIVQRDRFGHMLPTSSGIPPFVPFQKQHIVTSDDNIILNSIRCTPERGWNAVAVSIGKDTADVAKGDNVISLVADADIEPGAIIRKYDEVTWTTNKQMAHQYALGLLKEGVEKLYGGTLVVKGNPKIEPYDKMLIMDRVNKMYGWIEVETVIHKFDSQMGFTTHVVPNMVCAINGDTYATTGHIARMMIWEQIASGKALQFAASAIIGAGIGSAAALTGAWAPILLGVIGIFSVAQSVARNTNSLLDKYMPPTAKPEHAYITDLLADSVRDTVTAKWSLLGFHTTTLIRIIRDIKWRDGAKYLAHQQKRAVLSVMSAGQFAKEIRLSHSILATTESMSKDVKKELKKMFKEHAEDPKSCIKALEEFEAKLDGVAEDTEVRKQIKSLKETLKQVDKNQTKAGAIEKARTKLGDMKSPLEPMEFGKSLLKRTGSALMVTFLLQALEELPMLFESFLMKSAARSSAITVSPLWHKGSMMIGGLDGYQNNDAVMHIRGIVINAKRTIAEVSESLSNYSIPDAFGLSSSDISENKAAARSSKASKAPYRAPIMLDAKMPENLQAVSGPKAWKEFIQAAQELQAKSGIPASVTLAQFIEESGSNKQSELAVKHNNLFGTKARSDQPSVIMHGKYHNDTAAYVSYSSIRECLEDRGNYMWRVYHETGAFDTSNPRDFVKAIAPKYAENKLYASNLISIIDRYKLDQYDLKATPQSVNKELSNGRK